MVESEVFSVPEDLVVVGDHLNWQLFIMGIIF